MRYSIATINDPFHIRVTTFGEATGVRFQWKFTEITNLIGDLNGAPVLIDERKSDFDAINAWDLMLARNFLVEKSSALASIRIAFLVGPGTGIYVANWLRDLVEKECLAEIEVFSEEGDAMKWLQHSSDASWVMSMIPLFISGCALLNAADAVMV